MPYTGGSSSRIHSLGDIHGILTDPEALADHLVKRRIETLAWLVANDRLEIKVCVEADPQTGAPIVSKGYFHAKSGILPGRVWRCHRLRGGA